jgi:hypothetical protein
VISSFRDDQLLCEHLPGTLKKMTEFRGAVLLQDLSASELGYALGPANEVVNERPDPVGENDDKDPNDLFVPLIRLFGRTLHDHPNPENGASHADEQTKEHKTKSDHLRPSRLRWSVVSYTPLYAARFKKVPWPALPWN